MSIVRRGDVVLVQMRTWVPSVELFYDREGRLQQRLQTAGFEVVSIDDQLSWVGTRGDLFVSVRPLSSDYGSPQDVASVVAGAAYAVGYGAADSASGRIVDAAADPNDDAYSGNVNRDLFTNKDNPNLLGGLSSGLVIAAVAAIVALVIAARR